MGGIILGFEIAVGFALFFVLVWLVWRISPRFFLPIRAWYYFTLQKAAVASGAVVVPGDVRVYEMKRGMKQLEGADLSPETQRDLAVTQLAAAIDSNGTFDNMSDELIQDAFRRLGDAESKIEQRRQKIIDKGAAQGKTLSTEAVLKYVYEARDNYFGSNREEYVAEMNQFIQEFKQKHGDQIPVDEAYSILKEIERIHGKVEPEPRTDETFY